MNIEVPAVVSEGIIIAIVGYVIVFAALVVLYLVFNNLSKVINFNVRKKLRKRGEEIENGDVKELMIPGEVSAAISMALYLYNELHDEESNVITIKRISKTYSPWSSKLYGLRWFNR